MFPNVRLMMVAIAATVVVLGCGFGVYAALRVNHEPLARLPTTTASLQLVASNAAPPSTVVATSEPVEHGAPPSAPGDSPAQAAKPDPVGAIVSRSAGNPDVAAADMPKSAAAEQEKAAAVEPEKTATVETEKTVNVEQEKAVTPVAQPSSLTAVQPTEASAAVAVTPIPDDHPPQAPEPPPLITGSVDAPTSSPDASQQVPLPETNPGSAGEAKPDGLAEAKPNDVAETPAAITEPKPDGIPRANPNGVVETASGQPPVGTTAVTAVEPPKQSLPAPEPKQEEGVAPASAPSVAGAVKHTVVRRASAKPVARKVARKLAKTVVRQHVAVRAHRGYRLHARSVAYSDPRDDGFSEPYFQTAPHAQRPARRVRHVQTATGRPAGASPAVDGSYMNPTGE